MKTIKVEDVTSNIREMCIEANHFLTEDMQEALTESGSLSVRIPEWL